jgi:hypothetical protein
MKCCIVVMLLGEPQCRRTSSNVVDKGTCEVGATFYCKILKLCIVIYLCDKCETFLNLVLER